MCRTASTTPTSRALDPGTPLLPELRALPRPIIGFFGLIEEWVDLAEFERGCRVVLALATL